MAFSIAPPTPSLGHRVCGFSFLSQWRESKKTFLRRFHFGLDSWFSESSLCKRTLKERKLEFLSSCSQGRVGTQLKFAEKAAPCHQIAPFVNGTDPGALLGPK